MAGGKDEEIVAGLVAAAIKASRDGSAATSLRDDPHAYLREHGPEIADEVQVDVMEGMRPDASPEEDAAELWRHGIERGEVTIWVPKPEELEIRELDEEALESVSGGILPYGMHAGSGSIPLSSSFIC